MVAAPRTAQYFLRAAFSCRRLQANGLSLCPSFPATLYPFYAAVSSGRSLVAWPIPHFPRFMRDRGMAVRMSTCSRGTAGDNRPVRDGSSRSLSFWNVITESTTPIFHGPERQQLYARRYGIFSSLVRPGATCKNLSSIDFRTAYSTMQEPAGRCLEP